MIAYVTVIFLINLRIARLVKSVRSVSGSRQWKWSLLWRNTSTNIYPLNAELNPIWHLLVLLAAHPILHVSRIRVNDWLATDFYIRSLLLGHGFVRNLFYPAQ
jgi:hypothetical protein